MILACEHGTKTSAWVQSLACRCGIFRRRIGTGTSFPQSSLVFPPQCQFTNAPLFHASTLDARSLHKLSSWQHGYKHTSLSLYWKTRRICVINSRWFMKVKETLMSILLVTIVTLINQYLGDSLGYWPVEKVNTQLSLLIKF